ncbi:MAG: hypothetical protein WCW68_11030 [Methanothrix sp.]
MKDGLPDCKSGGVADNVSHRMNAESFAQVSAVLQKSQVGRRTRVFKV